MRTESQDIVVREIRELSAGRLSGLLSSMRRLPRSNDGIDVSDKKTPAELRTLCGFVPVLHRERVLRWIWD